MAITELQPTRRRGAPASRDVAIQLERVRRLVASLGAPPLPEPTQLHLPPADGRPMRSLYDTADHASRVEWAKSLSGDTAKTVMAALRRAELLGPMRSLAAAPSPQVIEDLVRDFPHFAEAIALIEQRAALARCCGEATALTLPPLLLTGPPGLGKTAFASALAKAIGSAFRLIDMATVHTSFTLVGLDAGYATGKPGMIWDALDGECMAPIIVLDELDKARAGTHEDPTTFLYSLLEPVTATRFTDAAIGLPLDASRIVWIATSNDETLLHPALRSRFVTLTIRPPTREEMTPIVASIQRALLAASDWGGHFDPTLAPAVMNKLCALTPREVRQALESAYARAAVSGRKLLVADDVQQRPSSNPTRMGFI